MTRISIKGMTEQEVAEAMANYTEADYLAEQAEVERQARLEAEEERLYGCTDYELDLYEVEGGEADCYWEDGQWWAI